MEINKIKLHKRTEDLTGKVFGKLTVLGFAGYKKRKNGKNAAQWLCKCTCGNEKIIPATYLKTGDTKSCGNCNSINVGDKFENLEVIKFVGYKTQKNGNRVAQWLCKCVCGKESVVVAGHLKSRHTKSCGCLFTSPIGGYSEKYKFFYDSIWELNFVKILEYLEVKWEREPKKFKLNNGRKYIPDFYLHEFNMFIEIKGYWYEDENGFSIQKEKTRLFKKEYPEYKYYVIDSFEYKEWKKEFNFLFKEEKVYEKTNTNASSS